MSGPRVITEELGGSALARAAQRGELPQWYVARPTSTNAWRAYLRDVASKHATRDWYEPLAPAIAATGEAAARVRRVVDSGGVVISTGQQAALFGGPLYTLIKAIGALGFADALESATGVATVVVFWAATDDADYDEASWASVAVAGGLRTLRLSPAPRAGAPMSEMPMPGVERLVAELAQACGSVSNVDALDSVRDLYTSRVTLGDAYVGQLRVLLEPLGIAVLDASQEAVRRAAAPVLSRALTAAAPLESALRERYEAIAGARFTPQVEHLPGLSLVFATEGRGEKRRLPVTDAANVLGRHAIETLSPNVLLRPIVERFIMPSAAYLAGPGELAYFAQVHAAADALEVPRPLPVPRWSATILEPRIERLLERLGVRRDDFRDRHAVESRLARGALPEDVAGSLRELRQDLEADVAALEVVDRDNLVPPASLQGLRRSLLHRLERMERRYLAAVKRRESALMRDIATAAASLYPNGMRQERVLNFVPFLARYGAPLLVQLRSEATLHAMTLVGASTGMSASVPERV
jgi:bacillithiol biosynthesis cysteine-adding enzyme BshC